MHRLVPDMTNGSITFYNLPLEKIYLIFLRVHKEVITLMTKLHWTRKFYKSDATEINLVGYYQFVCAEQEYDSENA